MKKENVYDLPTRIFHWLFAALFVAAFSIAKLIDDDSALYSQHMILGYILFFLTALRIVWGFIGSHYARFNSFPLKPALLLSYFKDILARKGKRYFGHNPASAWATLFMIGLALGLGITGYLMQSGNKELFEDAHEMMANAFVVVAIAHILGLILHSVKHRDKIGLSMLHGKKLKVDHATPIRSNHEAIALGLILIVGFFTYNIYSNYDRTHSTTSLFGISLKLGENESEESEEYEETQDRYKPNDTDENEESEKNED
jgi:cytochrome b